jgi:hypothetical protein
MRVVVGHVRGAAVAGVRGPGFVAGVRIGPGFVAGVRIGPGLVTGVKIGPGLVAGVKIGGCAGGISIVVAIGRTACRRDEARGERGGEASFHGEPPS